MNLKKNLELGGTNLLNCLCPQERYLPYWHIVVDDRQVAEYEFRPHCNAHNVGRWWNTMLRLHAWTGFDIEPAIETALLEHTWAMCDNPTGTLLEDPDPDNPRTWYIHSYRETMLALAQLASVRGDERAVAQGRRAITQMREASRDLTRWDLHRCGALTNPDPVPGSGGEPTYTHGRALEGILAFYEATREPIALEEAERLADFHFQYTVRPDGRLAAGSGHHTHSYLNTLRGLLLFAMLKQQTERQKIILATYRNAVTSMITRSGYLTHDIGDATTRSGGDISSAGDIAHLALLLWDCFHEPDLLDDVERLVRARLVPAQVLDPMPIRPRCDDPANDAFRDLPQRFVGAIGGSVGHARGQACVTDFTAAALHSLIEIDRRAVDVDDESVRINVHVDAVRPGLCVKTRRDGTMREVSIQDQTGKPLWIRLPAWTPRDAARLAINDSPAAMDIQKGFVRIPAASQGARRIRLRFLLPEEVTHEPWRETEATQDHLAFHWRGDEIIRVDPIGRYMEPFPRICRSFRGEF